MTDVRIRTRELTARQILFTIVLCTDTDDEDNKNMMIVMVMMMKLITMKVMNDNCKNDKDSE